MNGLPSSKKTYDSWNIPAISKMLKVSPSTIRMHIACGNLPAIDFGFGHKHCFRVLDSDLQTFLAGCRHEALADAIVMQSTKDTENILEDTAGEVGQGVARRGRAWTG